MIYKAVRNTVVDALTGQQIAVMLPTHCSMKDARQMAAFAAQQMNHIERDKARKKEKPHD